MGCVLGGIFGIVLTDVERRRHDSFPGVGIIIRSLLDHGLLVDLISHNLNLFWNQKLSIKNQSESF